MRKLRLRRVKSFAQGEEWNLGLPDPESAGVSLRAFLDCPVLSVLGSVGLRVLGVGGTGAPGRNSSPPREVWREWSTGVTVCIYPGP